MKMRFAHRQRALRFALLTSVLTLVFLAYTLPASAHTHPVHVRHSLKPSISSQTVGPALRHWCGSNWTTIHYHYSYVPSDGSVGCNSATWNDHSFTGYQNCDVQTFIPADGYPYTSQAVLTYGIFNMNGQQIGSPIINQAQYDGQWVDLGTYGAIGYVYMADNDGQNGPMIGVSFMQFTCS